MPHVCLAICSTLKKGDQIKYQDNPTQTGFVERKNVMGVCNAVIRMNEGPIFPVGKQVLLLCFQGDLVNIERVLI